MWDLEPSEEYRRRHKRFEKNHPRELAAVLVNLATYQTALKSCARPQQVNFGFMHAEPSGVVALDQKRGGKNLRQTRLYVFPDADTGVLHLITVGGKDTQSDDIQFCREYVQSIQKQKEEGQQIHEPDKTDPGEAGPQAVS
ncbi:MAG: hypothetical protein K2R98_06220 [Gemmataceae bacterium]|nr:hypothetical protein [Gemmataceae bacterium]